jgi:hypothetical protein
VPRLAAAIIHELAEDRTDFLKIEIRHDQMMTAPNESISLAQLFQVLWRADGDVEQLAGIAIARPNRQSERADEVFRVVGLEVPRVEVSRLCDFHCLNGRCHREVRCRLHIVQERHERRSNLRATVGGC